jgi:predicted Rossmann fold flavoprotein
LKDLIIIGGGAAGFFAASEILRKKPYASVVILEKTGKVLSKVKISGGGRCNVTHHCFEPEKLIEFYPRGNPWLLDVFRKFQVRDTLRWFDDVGVRIVPEADGRMFPSTNNSQTIVDTLAKGAKGLQFSLRLHSAVRRLSPASEGFELELESGETLQSRNVLVASGGSPSGNGFAFLQSFGFSVVPPVPSLFTFNVENHPWKELMGLSVSLAAVKLEKSDLSFTGPVLVTHWGFSGPAILKLSAFGARLLHEQEYRYSFSLDWLPEYSAEEVEKNLLDYQLANPKKRPDQSMIFPLPKRLWEKVCGESGLSDNFNWAEAGKKKIQEATRLLKKRVFIAQGKTTYKEEFITSGGIDLNEIDATTCQAKRFPGLFFAGEVLNIDGVTGGFNFQAAWSTAFCASSEIIKSIK